MSKKTNTGLVKFVKKMVGQAYWFGTYGQIGNPKLLESCAKRYPSQFSGKRIAQAKERGDYGKRVMDCGGLIKDYLMTKEPDVDGMPMPPIYNKDFDMSANVMHSRATEKGPIGSIPEIPGLGLWKNNHVGVYIGDGDVVQAKGFNYGVIEDGIKDTAWEEWFKIPGIEYESASVPADPAESSASSASSDPAEDDFYIVKAGDTLTKIAKMWGVSVSVIAKDNGILNPDLIRVGQKIHRPEENTSVWTGTVATNRDPLRVRKTASLNAPVVRLLPKGSKVAIKGEKQGDWYELADGTGFVFASFIK